jgi:hypothetical protein
MLCFVSLVGSKVGAEWPIQDEEEETGSQEFESFFSMRCRCGPAGKLLLLG